MLIVVETAGTVSNSNGNPFIFTVVPRAGNGNYVDAPNADANSLAVNNVIGGKIVLRVGTVYTFAVNQLPAGWSVRYSDDKAGSTC